MRCCVLKGRELEAGLALPCQVRRALGGSGPQSGLGLLSRVSTLLSACTLHGPNHLHLNVCPWSGVSARPEGPGACDLCPPHWVIKGFTRPSGRPTGFPWGEIMHLKAGPSQPCTLNGPLVLQTWLSVPGLAGAWVPVGCFCQARGPARGQARAARIRAAHTWP